MKTISIPVNNNLAASYHSASADEQGKIILLINLWLSEFTEKNRKLKFFQSIKKLSIEAKQKGLTPSILAGILNEKK